MKLELIFFWKVKCTNELLAHILFFLFSFFLQEGEKKKRRQGHSFLELFSSFSLLPLEGWAPFPEAQQTPVGRGVGSVMAYPGALNSPTAFGESQIRSALRGKG